MVRFPILKRLKVTGYQLFPNRDDSGIDRTIEKGVTIVAGVNGLGKTTLLNMLFRALAGPFDWRVSRADSDLGNLKHSLIKWRSPSYFQDRVRDGAANARIEVEIGIGKATITVGRSLRDLSVLELSLNRTPLQASEERFQNIVMTEAGVESFFDFYLLLRYMVFFLEDRRPLIWDRSAQDEILRILFYPKGEAKRVGELIDEIQSLDSEVRNMRVFVNRRQTQLENLEAQQKVSAQIRSRLNSAVVKIDALRSRLAEVNEEVERCNGDRLKIRQRLAREKLLLEETKRDHQRERQRYFAQLFPNIGEVANYVLVNLDSGAGCLVCGNQGPDAADRIHKLTAEGICPVCGAAQAQQDTIVPKSRLSKARLDEIADKLRQQLANVRGLDDELISRNESYRLLVEQQISDQSQIEESEHELGVIRGTWPVSGEEIDRLRRLVDDGRADMNDLRAKQRTYEYELEKVIGSGREFVAQRSSEIATHFEEFATHFLSERCQLTYALESRKFGQETASFQMPRFTVKMTSGVFAEQAQPRTDRDDVSESQKEFIDLAFRMALMTAAAKNDPAMLVLETPEANLDSVFVARAGRLLQTFANGGGGIGNRLIASSNLNKEDMVPALFGLASEERYTVWDRDGRSGDPPESANAVPSAQRLDRVINLLKIAAPTAALQQYENEYEVRFREALFPGWAELDRQKGK
jgi:hypothetical protein